MPISLYDQNQSSPVMHFSRLRLDYVHSGKVPGSRTSYLLSTGLRSSPTQLSPMTCHVDPTHQPHHSQTPAGTPNCAQTHVIIIPDGRGTTRAATPDPPKSASLSPASRGQRHRFQSESCRHQRYVCLAPHRCCCPLRAPRTATSRQLLFLAAGGFWQPARTCVRAKNFRLLGGSLAEVILSLPVLRRST